jgi:hypothetical protein
MLKKDLKLISRTPSYAMVVMLPVFESLFFVSDFGKYSSIGATVTILCLMVIVSFIIFAIESTQYTRILPVDVKFIINAKAVLTTLVYVVSILVVGIVLAFKGKYTILGFTQIPTVYAVSLIVFILTAKLGVKANMQTGLVAMVVLFLPGFITAMIPLGVGLVMSALYNLNLEPVSFISSLVEMVVAIAILNVVRLQEFW